MSERVAYYDRFGGQLDDHDPKADAYFVRSSDFAALRERAEKAEAERDELQATFDLQYAADLRAIQMFKDAHPDFPENTWPDRADLFAWVASDRHKTETLCRKLMAAGGRLSAALAEIMSVAGSPDAVDACRRIIGMARDALRGKEEA